MGTDCKISGQIWLILRKIWEMLLSAHKKPLDLTVFGGRQEFP